MNKTKRFQELFITFAFFFFIALQFFRLDALQISYLGEEISFTISPVYVLMGCLIIVVLYVILYLPLLVVVTIEFKVNWNPMVIVVPCNRYGYKTRELSFVTNKLFMKYRVVRC